MTPRERAVAALEGRTPDRVPCAPLIDTSYAAACAGMPVTECFINPEAYAAALVATLDRHPDIDGVSINIGLCDEVFVAARQKDGTHTIKTTGGLTWMVPENDIGSIEHCQITDFHDERIATHDYLMRACLRTPAAIPRKCREKHLINATVTGPFSQVAFWSGMNAPAPPRARSSSRPLALRSRPARKGNSPSMMRFLFPRRWTCGSPTRARRRPPATSRTPR